LKDVLVEHIENLGVSNEYHKQICSVTGYPMSLQHDSGFEVLRAMTG
jgi:hypothetical protein